MIKRSPSRNHRSKGIKVKQVLQIILLLGICFWLIYQVKHSHDKRKEFDDNDAKVSARTQTAYQTPKLGRKDLHPRKDEVNQNEKHEEEEEDENIVEDEDKHVHSGHEEEQNGHESEEKDDNKHGMRGGEEEDDENRNNEMEDERGGGDDEIDENDQEQLAVVDADRDEEFMDEENEKEESDEKENEKSHEAREEHYKGDDASSAVAHDSHATSTETETVSLEKSDGNSEMNITKSGNRANYTEESNRNQHSSNFNITDVELAVVTSSNATSEEETGSSSLSNTVDNLNLDNTTTINLDSHSEARINLTVVIPGSSNNMTETSADTLSKQNKMVIFSESNQSQNGNLNTTVAGDVKNWQTEGLEQGGNKVSEENLPGANSTETGDAAAGESSNLDGGELEKTTRFVASNETGIKGNTETSETNNTQNISYMKENTDATKDEESKGDTQTDETSDSSSTKGTSDSVELHDTDSSESHILKEVTEARTDLDTLPDFKIEGDNGDATATD